MSSLPRISVLVLNPGGREHSDACRSSLEAQTYPRDRFHINIVGSGSDGSCAAYNAAIRNCDSDFVALVGDDVRVDPQWLVELVSAADRNQASAVASRILDPAGQTSDFGGGTISFTGHPIPIAAGEPATGRNRADRVLYASCDSALFSRAAFLEAGGFDESFAGCLEDVDLGWRLNLLGHTIVLAPDAIAYRETNAASVKPAPARRERLIERNALAMIYTNYEAATFERAFPVAVALSLMRGLQRSGIETLTLELASQPPEIVNVDRRLVGHLLALEDFCRQLPSLRTRRELVQQRRKRSDAALSDLFADPLRFDASEHRAEEAARALVHDFRVEYEMFKPQQEADAPASHAERPQRPDSRTPPKVSIVILTALGSTHLPECLDALRQQTYPPDLVEVIIVDNGSADDPTAEAERHYPGVRVIRNSTNLGFAAGNNIGAAAATGEYLVFLNDDTRVTPGWLREMVDAALRRGAGAVASCIVDWSGKDVDFVGGAVNFQGKGFQLEYDRPIQSVSLDEKPLLFACGCAMLVERSVFFDAGGWDQQTFAYYEDVELGWRFNLLGHSVWFAPRAVVRHKHHGTSGRWPEPPRLRLYERNSLRMIYALLDTKTLQRALPVALLLAADRALLGTGLSRAVEQKPRDLIGAAKASFRARGVTKRTSIAEAVKRLGVRGTLSVVRDVLVPRRVDRSRRDAYSIVRGRRPLVPNDQNDQHEPIPIAAAAALSGIYAFLSDLPELSRRRTEIQHRRCRTDDEVLGQFASHWLETCPSPCQSEHDALHAALIQEFGLDADVFRREIGR